VANSIFLSYVLPIGLLIIGVIVTLWIKRQSRMFDQREVLQRRLRRALKTGDFIHFDQDMMWLVLPDGVQQGIPLRNYEWLLQADSEDRRKYSADDTGIHWVVLNKRIEIDEILCVDSAWKFKTAT